jgi:hypothetical protein
VPADLLLHQFLNYEIEDTVSQNQAAHLQQIAIEHVHKEAERSQCKFGLVDFIKIPIT